MEKLKILFNNLTNNGQSSIEINDQTTEELQPLNTQCPL